MEKPVYYEIVSVFYGEKSNGDRVESGPEWRRKIRLNTID
jgi:hypothetical protein